MLSLTTPVALPASPPRLAYGQMGLSFGSCFSERITDYLTSGGMELFASPFGIQYNPLSIASGLRLLLSEEELTASDLTERDGLFHSFLHHGAYSCSTVEETLAGMNEALGKVRKTLPRLDFLLVTWGTAYVYRLADPALGRVGEVVSNCHKFPEKAFSRSRVSVEDLLAVWIPLLDDLFLRQPQLRIIQTVSPVRHLRDGAHGNALSKSTLLLFAEALSERYPQHIHYFPAYEIVLDELRDYRYYAEDMTHPSPLAVRIIRESFVDWAVEPKTAEGLQEAEKLLRELSHIPLHATSEAHHQRQGRLREKLSAFRSRYPDAHLHLPPLWID